MFKFTHERQGMFERDLAYLDKLEGHDPREIAWNRALILLGMGNFKEGWPLFEHRLAVPGCRFSYDHFTVKRWHGEDLTSKSVMVWLDQGIGDQILAASMLGDLAKKCGEVCVIAARRLVPLLRRAYPDIHFHKVGEPMNRRMKWFDFDYQLSMSDVGQITRNDISNFPYKPFLTADAEKVAHFKAKYSAHGSRRIGISWASQSKVAEAQKSIAFESMFPIIARPDTLFLNMQYDPRPDDVLYMKQNKWPVLLDDEVDQLIDMDTFAAQLSAMDMVVSASSSMVHLAGALGVPTLLLVPHNRGSHWYWTHDQECPIWYPSITMLRQDEPGDWELPIAQAASIITEAKCLAA